ncbi:MAG: NAD-dependent epimerase/dehydratase family protein [Flavobacteriaceae bacterium]
MRILITGGAGTLGSNIVKQFEIEKIPYRLIDNFETGSVDNIKGIPEEKIIEGSILNTPLLEKIFHEFAPTQIIHSAASYKDPDDFEKDAQVNVTGSIILSRLAQKYNVQKIINFQTALCYGRPTTVPIPVDSNCKPFTSYGISKYFGEYYLLNAPTKVVSLRLANICSENLAIGPIPTFYNRLKAGKDCFISDAYRDFLDFDDFYSLLKKVLLDKEGSGIFNVSTGESTHIKEIFDLIKVYLSKEDTFAPIKPIGDDDVFNTTLDPSETMTYFDWQPKVNLKAIIAKQLANYDKKPIEQIYSHLKNE